MTARRDFIKTLAGTSLAFALPSIAFANYSPVRDKWGELLPLKDFGSMDEKVTMLGVGGFHVGRMEDTMAEKTIDLAIEKGIRYFDTAESYQSGVSEEKYGKFLTPKYRDEIFLMTKTRARDRKTAEEHLEGSLKRLKTDRLDLWLMHAINSEEDAENRLNNGVVDFMLEAKEKGKIRHLGFSGHTTTKGHLKLLGLSKDIEACMLPINAVDTGYDSFINNVLPVLKKRKMGVIAMKTMAGGAFFGQGFDGRNEAQDIVMNHITIKDAFHYALSVPNDVLVTGAKTPEMLQEKIDLVNNFKQLSDSEMNNIFRKIEDFAGKVEYFKGID